MPSYRLNPAWIFLDGYNPGGSTYSDTTSSQSITATDTSITVADASGLPDSGVVTIDSEEIAYLGKSSNTLTKCVRGWRGTTAATHDGSTTAVDVEYTAKGLGKTYGGITLNMAESTQKIQTDQDGETPVDESITGTEATVEASLADYDLETFAFIHKTTVQGTSPSRCVEIGANVGTSLMENYVKAVIVPYVNNTLEDDVETYITMPKAGITASESLTYDATTQQVIKVTLKSYPDSNQNILILGKES